MDSETLPPQEPTPDDLRAVQTFYVNAVKMMVTPYDFGLVMLQSAPTGYLAPQCRVMMSPAHAKVLSVILQKHVEAYERKVGAICISPGLIPIYDEMLRSEIKGT